MQGKMITANAIDLICSWEKVNITISKTQGVAQVVNITCKDASTLEGGNYFIINSPYYSCYVWYCLGGNERDPKEFGKIGIKVNLESTDTATQIAAKTAVELNKFSEFSCSSNNAILTVTCNTKDEVKEESRDVDTKFNMVIATPGLSPILFDGALWPDVVEILDINILNDGSAKILVKVANKVKYLGQGRPTCKPVESIKFSVQQRSVPAGWIVLS